MSVEECIKRIANRAADVHHVPTHFVAIKFTSVAFWSLSINSGAFYSGYRSLKELEQAIEAVAKESGLDIPYGRGY